MLALRVVSLDGKPYPTPCEAEFDASGGSIGRRPDNRLALSHDLTVSTVHATIRFSDGQYFLTPRGRNASRLNGRRLNNGIAETLADGDELALGASVLAVVIKPREGIVRQLSFTILEDIARDLSTETIAFPTFLDITVTIRNALKNPNLTIDELGTLVSAEPLLSAKVIHLANAVALNPAGRTIITVNHAIAQVGMEAVRGLSFAVAIDQLLGSKKMVPFEALSRRLWEHSMHVAALCRVLARGLTRINPDEAMFVGLIHDIGVFYLLSRAANFPEVIDDPGGLYELLVQWHEHIGHALLAAMRLPEETLTAVRDHEAELLVATVKTLPEVLFVANRLANVEHAWRDPKFCEAVDATSLSALFDAEELRALLADSAEDVDSLKRALST
jgi:HD-like signal output (HDOD) protein